IPSTSRMAKLLIKAVEILILLPYLLPVQYLIISFADFFGNHALRQEMLLLLHPYPGIAHLSLCAVDGGKLYGLLDAPNPIGVAIFRYFILVLAVEDFCFVQIPRGAAKGFSFFYP